MTTKADDRTYATIAYTEALRADRAEDALREREKQLARVLEMADAWDETWGDNGVKASVLAEAVRNAIRNR